MNGNTPATNDAYAGIGFSRIGTQPVLQNRYENIYITHNSKMSVLLAKDLRHFVDMVYIHSAQKGFIPDYICQSEFKSHIEDVRRFDRENDGKAVEEHVPMKYTAMCEAYMVAMIVYGFIKELAHKGDGTAAEVYETLRQLMPFKIS